MEDIYSEITQYNDSEKNIYEILIQKYPTLEVDYVMYDLFQYTNIETEEKIKRKDQTSFRNDVIERYEQCLITGVDALVCQACHIIPFSECEEIHKYDVNNGLLLRSDLHTLFDEKLLKINPNSMQIELSDKILENKKMSRYYKYNGKILLIPEFLFLLAFFD